MGVRTTRGPQREARAEPDRGRFEGVAQVSEGSSSRSGSGGRHTRCLWRADRSKAQGWMGVDGVVAAERGVHGIRWGRRWIWRPSAPRRIPAVDPDRKGCDAWTPIAEPPIRSRSRRSARHRRGRSRRLLPLCATHVPHAEGSGPDRGPADASVFGLAVGRQVPHHRSRSRAGRGTPRTPVRPAPPLRRPGCRPAGVRWGAAGRSL